MTDQETLVADPGQPPTPSDPSSSTPGSRARTNMMRRSATTMIVAFAGYLGLSVLLWWNVWSTHPTSVAGCPCDDPSLFVWLMEWPAYAIAHGLNPFYSTAMFHPTGINLLSNTGVLAIGIPLAPVTWLFGPVATLNVASTLAPAITALAMFWLLRRWVSWGPAAFVGGLVFGFSPYIFTNLAVDHLNDERPRASAADGRLPGRAARAPATPTGGGRRSPRTARGARVLLEHRDSS